MKNMDGYERYTEITTRVLLHISHTDGLQEAMLAAHAMIDTASAILAHELKKDTQRIFPDTPQFPDDAGVTLFVCRNGIKITTRREPIISLHSPTAA